MVTFVAWVELQDFAHNRTNQNDDDNDENKVKRRVTAAAPSCLVALWLLIQLPQQSSRISLTLTRSPSCLSARSTLIKIEFLFTFFSFYFVFFLVIHTFGAPEVRLVSFLLLFACHWTLLSTFQPLFSIENQLFRVHFVRISLFFSFWFQLSVSQSKSST